MKKIYTLLLAIIVCVGLVACGDSKESQKSKGPQGTYCDNLGFSEITFSGKNVEFVSLNNEEPIKGTFVIDGDDIEVSYEDGRHDIFTYDENEDTLEYAAGMIFYNVNEIQKQREINAAILSEAEYLIPFVCVEKDFDAWVGRMSETNQTMLKEYYKKLNLDNLPKSYDREEVLAKYPVIEETPIYVLRDNVKDSIKQRIEKAFGDAGYTRENYVTDYLLMKSE